MAPLYKPKSKDLNLIFHWVVKSKIAPFLYTVKGVERVDLSTAPPPYVVLL